MKKAGNIAPAFNIIRYQVSYFEICVNCGSALRMTGVSSITGSGAGSGMGSGSGTGIGSASGAGIITGSCFTTTL
jgi:hypothetical protein